MSTDTLWRYEFDTCTLARGHQYPAIQEVMDNRAARGWRLVGMTFEAPVYTLFWVREFSIRPSAEE